MLARWCLVGRPIARNLAAARFWFGVAADLGRADAASIHTAFLGSGVGGPRDWAGALARLRAAAENFEAQHQLALIEAMLLDESGEPLAIPEGEAIGGQLPVTRFEGFCTPAECSWLAGAAEPLFAPAGVIDPGTGALLRNPIRTSDAASFPFIAESPAIHAINRRIAAISRTRPEQGEPLQILRYAPGQEYRPHVDALPGDAVNQRIATVLVYLNDDYMGGETSFVETGLTIRARTGDAILFSNTSDGRPDMRMRHAGLPVRRGTKLVASRWIRERPLLSGSSG
jgi:prolyl 4-hydroxylase